MTIKNGDLPAMPMWCEQLEQQLYGLTKREQFAAMAMQGILANSSNSMSYVARDAVLMADELLAELERAK